MDIENIKRKIRTAEEDIHYPGTKLICLENAYSDGSVPSLEYMKDVYNIAKDHNLMVHLDGARLFNASTYLGCHVKELTKYCDSLMFCLSKGLCAPVGSIVAGSKEFIERARKKRKLMGGGLRQCGILAAAGLIALKDMTSRLHEDHENAKLLAQELSKIPGLKVFKEDTKINLVFFSMEEADISDVELQKFMMKKNIKINLSENGLMRFATHYWVTEEHVHIIADTVREAILSK